MSPYQPEQLWWRSSAPNSRKDIAVVARTIGYMGRSVKEAIEIWAAPLVGSGIYPSKLFILPSPEPNKICKRTQKTQ
jgi:hypothetical protein